MSTSGPITQFPAAGLRNPQRLITGHNDNGKAVFLATDHGDHQAVMVEGAAAQNIFYSTGTNPVDINGDADIAFARQKKPALHIPSGSVVRMIDFAPDAESHLHRSVCLAYGCVIEGQFELTLDSGEKKIMLPGDISVNRSTMHKWRNVTPIEGTSGRGAGRMLFVILDVKPVFVSGQELQFDLGDLAQEYA